MSSRPYFLVSSASSVTLGQFSSYISPTGCPLNAFAAQQGNNNLGPDWHHLWFFVESHTWVHTGKSLPSSLVPLRRVRWSLPSSILDSFDTPALFCWRGLSKSNQSVFQQFGSEQSGALAQIQWWINSTRMSRADGEGGAEDPRYWNKLCEVGRIRELPH